MVKIKLTPEYLKSKNVNVSGEYITEVKNVRAKELVEAGSAVYVDKPVEVKEVKNKKTKVMKPRKKRTYFTK